MNNAARLTLVLVCASAAPAFAQDNVPSNPPPVATVAQYPAPMTNSWGEVSHINGTLVPVGEHNDYLYTFRKTNISTNPVGWIAGVYGVSASYAVSENFVIKGDVNLFNKFFGTDGYEVNATALLYFKRAYDGPFIEAGFIQRETHDHVDDGDCSDCDAMSTPEMGPEVLVGWSRMFDSGFNLSMAAGAMRDVNAKSDDEYSDDNNIDLVGYFRAGYAF